MEGLCLGYGFELGLEGCGVIVDEKTTEGKQTGKCKHT